MFDNEKDKQNARQFTKQRITFKFVNLKNIYHPLIMEWECIIKAAGNNIHIYCLLYNKKWCI